MFNNRLITIFLIIFVCYSISRDIKIEKPVIIDQRLIAVNNDNNSPKDLKIAEPANKNPGFIQEKLSDAINTTIGKKIADNFLISNQSINYTDFPEILKSMQLVNEIKGSGNFAKCGKKVEINHKLTLADGEIISESNNDNFRIGDGTKPLYIDFLAENMQEGAKKIVNIPARLIKSLKKNNQMATLEIELLKTETYIKPEFQIFDKIKNIGKVILCGDTAIIKYRILNIEGKEIFNIDKLDNFIIGHPETPEFINLLIEYSSGGSQKTAILPYDVWSKSKNVIFPDPNIAPLNQAIIFELDIIGKAEFKNAQ